MSIFINLKTLLPTLLLFVMLIPASASAKPDAEQLFKQKCSFCHAIDKKKLGPAVNTMSSDEKILREIITKGKKPMPSYKGKLTGDEIDSLVNYLLANQ